VSASLCIALFYWNRKWVSNSSLVHERGHLSIANPTLGESMGRVTLSLTCGYIILEPWETVGFVVFATFAKEFLAYWINA
jgi:hypothetical protein